MISLFLEHVEIDEPRDIDSHGVMRVPRLREKRWKRAKRLPTDSTPTRLQSIRPFTALDQAPELHSWARRIAWFKAFGS